MKLPGVLMKEMKKQSCVKTKLYSKLLSKNYIDYFSLHTYFLKNQKVLLSCNRDFCNFKLKFSANWHKSLIHY